MADATDKTGTAYRDAVADACAYIEAAPTIPSLATLAARSGLGTARFLRQFRDHTSLTPRSFAEGVRARRVHAARLAQPDDPARPASPVLIRTALTDSAFGRLLLGATEHGVCFLGFAEPDAALLGDLAHRFPAARMESDTAGLAAFTATVLDFIADPRQLPALPLDLHGTAFQLRVWEALRRIPAGQTRSYGALAQMVGAPRAVRAVARSCARNPVSLAVPCHRVVGCTGDLTGYRWGVPRKQALLAREHAATRPPPRRTGISDPLC